ncbi:Hypothetical protein ERGA_CDS_07480 [Ehrlichia ruminantium str. Gardel]|uniref:Uncharacterized protein n=1 Tax=Ehrlichia ruminantium (strain Welgevonden) TaxID=254945 RepID=A0A0H3M6M4_EHRRW|nr:Hypothetical protein ERWE_CDS_07560 [Ehrlichia ruminantium str. Welgevonden]CAI28200.1 Hypothetical protein ERGA_CDS_07480 [Ehrlichia ruminantium str. Gardel]
MKTQFLILAYAISIQYKINIKQNNNIITPIVLTIYKESFITIYPENDVIKLKVKKYEFITTRDLRFHYVLHI